MSYGQNPYGQPAQPYGQPAPQPGWNPAPQQPGYPVQPGQNWAPQQPAGQPAWQQPPSPYPPTQTRQQPAPGGWPAGNAQPGPPTTAAPAQPVPPSPVPEPEPRQAAFTPAALPVSTTESIPGHEVTAVLGAVVGVITQPRDLKAGPELSVILTEIRQDAVTAMVTMAVGAGADAVVGLHFDTGPISGATSEVVAYGTAVMLDGNEPVASTDESAEPQISSDALDPDVEAEMETVVSADIDAEVAAAAATLDADPGEGTGTGSTAADSGDDPAQEASAPKAARAATRTTKTSAPARRKSSG